MSRPVAIASGGDAKSLPSAKISLENSLRRRGPCRTWQLGYCVCNGGSSAARVVLFLRRVGGDAAPGTVTTPVVIEIEPRSRPRGAGLTRPRAAAAPAASNALIDCQI